MRRIPSDLAEEQLVKHIRQLAAAGTILGLGCVAGGCGYALSASAANQPAATSLPPTKCFVTDLTKIRAMAAAKPKVDDATLPAKVQKSVKSTDARSFITTVSPSDLTAAGINTSSVSAVRPLLVIVNHGAWDSSQLAINTGGDNSTGPGGAARAGKQILINWIVVIYDAQTYQPVGSEMAPDYPCFIGG